MNKTTSIQNDNENLVHDDARICTIAKNGLNDQQHAAIEMLVLGKALGPIAQTLQVAPSTLYRWRQDELFQLHLAERRRELWGTATDRIKDLVHPSIEVLAEQLANPYDRSRFRAASTVLRLINLKHQES
jgi:hypothetical protein